MSGTSIKKSKYGWSCLKSTITLAATLLFSSAAHAFSTGQVGYSGSPSDGQTCSSCHAGGSEALLNCGNLNTGSFSYLGSIGASTSVGRGTTNSITFSLNRLAGTLMTKGGMGARINAGTFNGNTEVTVTNAASNNTATHNSTSNTPTGGNRSWSWSWTAPTAAGSQTLYVCGNPTNGNGNCDLDGPHTNTCSNHTFNVFNATPVANNDGSGASPFLTVSEDSLVYTNTLSVLTNDTDDDTDVGDVLSVFDFDKTSTLGDVINNGNGTFGYNPGGLFEGLDTGEISNQTFSYRITDGATGLSTSKTVFIRVTGVNDAPVAVSETITMNIAGTATTVIPLGGGGPNSSVLDNDSDIDVEALTAVLVTGPSFARAFNLNTDGTFSYQHDGTNNLSDKFSYQASDGTTTSGVVEVIITLNNTRPTAANDINVATVLEGGSVNFTVLGNDTDPETGLASAVVNVSNLTNGTVTIETNQSITFAHDGSETTAASFTYQASDGILTSLNTATVTLNVTSNNDAPVISEGGAIAVGMTEDIASSFVLTLNATDAESNNLSWTILTDASFGTASSTAGVGNSNVISYSPNLNLAGTAADSFVVQVTDDGIPSQSATITVTVNITGVDDPPQITLANATDVSLLNNFSVTMSEDGAPTAFNLVLNATDPEGDAISWVLPNGVGATPSNGTASLSVTPTGPSQVISYTPNADFNGSDSFVVRTTANALNDTLRINVTIDPVNDAPVINAGAVSATVSMTEDLPGTFLLTLTATDVDSSNLSWDIVTAAGNGTATATGLGASKVIGYTPNPNLVGIGADSFVVRVTDDGVPSQSDTITVTVDIAGIDDPPVITEGAAIGVSMTEDLAGTFLLTLNATDPDNDPISWSIQTGATNGVASASGTGPSQLISYAPNADFNGVDSFVVRATANAVSTSITVTVTVAAVDDAPVITEGAALTVDGSEDTILIRQLTATDAEGGLLTWTIPGVVTNGQASVSSTGEFSFTPDLNFVGQGSFQVRVTDATNLSATINITVNVSAVNIPPVISQVSPLNVVMNEDNPASFSLTLNATDQDNDVISWSILTQATNGTAAATGTGTSKVIAYVPNTDFNGDDSFVVLVTANGQTDSITVNVTVNPIDDAPVMTNGGLDVVSVLVAMSEDSSPTPFILTLGATDADGGDLTWSVVTTGTIGSASASGIGTSKAIVYTPNLNQTGADSFIVRVTDNTALTDTITVNVNITAVDDGPTITEGASTTIVMSEDGNPTPFSLTLNATDPDGDVISWSISSTATNGVASVPAGAGNSKVISYAPTANFTGFDSFVVQASSNGLIASITVNVTVNPVNDAPVITEGAAVAVSMSEDSTPTAFELTLNATDVEASVLSWSINTNASNGLATATASGNSSTINYVPNLNFAGSDSFVVRVTDVAGLSASITVNVTLSPVDDAPVITEGVSVNVSMSEDASPTPFVLTLNASDPEANLISWDIQTAATSGNASVTGSGLSKVISYTPNPNFSGIDSFVVRATANALTDSITVNVTVQAVNDVPVITQGASSTINISEDNSPNAFALTLNATDADTNATLTWSISAAATSGSAAVSVIPTGTSQAISYTPNKDFNGTDAFTVQVSDGVDTANFVVNVNISAINDAPVISEGASVAISMSEDGVPNPFVLTLNALDTEGDSISWSIDTAAGNGSASVSAAPSGLTQAISYTPTLEFSGSDSFSVKASDGILNATITVNVTIIITNDAPQLADIADVIVNESVAMPVITALATDPDDANDGVALTYSLTTAPTGMVISNALATLGEISWTPPQTGEFNKQYAVTVTVADGAEDAAAPASKSFSVIVNPPDADGDQVADYDDFCPAIADSTNTDSDGDGTAGSDDNADDSIGGNACDNDDDNDGMSDVEEFANNFDPLDASDANQDADGDGISNLDEILAGTNPRTATITIDATGYQTPYILLPPTPALIHKDATIVIPDKRGPWRPGQYLISWFASNRLNGNLGSTQQTLNVRPLINLDADQTVAEGSSGAVRISLNGDAPSYPVVVNYTVSGTANSADHDATSGSLSLTAQNSSALISFNVLADTLNDANETIVFSLDSVTNAVIGSKARHTASISEANVAPKVALKFVQNGRDVSSGFVADGEVTVSANATDVNTGQTLSYDWQNSANALLAPTDLQTSSWTFTPSSGTYVIDLRVTDDGIPAQQTRVKRLFRVSVATPPVLGSGDSDGDGIADDVEGYGDSDNDGIPDYLDAQTETELLTDQSVILLNSRLLQTQQGLKLTIGNTALAAGIAGAAITDEDISNFGTDSGTAPLNASDEFEHLSGVYDFEISQLIPGATVRLVIPLQSAIPRGAKYRKFDPAHGWTDFVLDAENTISSAAGESGVCPEPGSEQYRSGMNYLHNCLQLQITDGGPNDQDGEVNGVVRDPGTLAIKLSDPETPVVQEGGAMLPGFLISLWLLGLFRLRQRYHQNVR
ncbi:MAG: tandem-95 repeat protein [Gammaproteobacteria bacterium]|nr:tandem-95 repeat protein [Gammaproteobacteria bacterium]